MVVTMYKQHSTKYLNKTSKSYKLWFLYKKLTASSGLGSGSSQNDGVECKCVLYNSVSINEYQQPVY